jgi:hypothetical protein
MSQRTSPSRSPSCLGSLRWSASTATSSNVVQPSGCAASTAGLSIASARVGVGPPLSASGASRASSGGPFAGPSWSPAGGGTPDSPATEQPRTVPTRL